MTAENASLTGSDLCKLPANALAGETSLVSVAKEIGRKPDARRTRADILSVARAEFVEHGLSGARVDAIAERTRTTKRMIYYYFGSKDGLYSAVLEQAYSDIRSTEATLALGDLDPLTALRRLIEFSSRSTMRAHIRISCD